MTDSLENLTLTAATGSTALDEETARAEVYGVLAALFYAPPDAAMLAQLASSAVEGIGAPAGSQGFLEEPWRNLVAAARNADAEAVRAEFETLFMGTGKPEVFLYGSHYLTGFLNERPLVLLRDDLNALGLTRQDNVFESEDHLAYLCEVMRYLIAGDDVTVANLTQQQAFYTAHLQPWINRACEAVVTHPKANFYRQLGLFAGAFADIERQGFDML